MTPEEKARQEIDHRLAQAGWIVQSSDEMNIFAGPGGAIREFSLNTDFVDTDTLQGVTPDAKPRRKTTTARAAK